MQCKSELNRKQRHSTTTRQSGVSRTSKLESKNSNMECSLRLSLRSTMHQSSSITHNLPLMIFSVRASCVKCVSPANRGDRLSLCVHEFELLMQIAGFPSPCTAAGTPSSHFQFPNETTKTGEKTANKTVRKYSKKDNQKNK